MATTPPPHFLCPITRTTLEDPVVAADGHVYSRTSIERWIRQDDMQPTSPMTNLPLANKDLRPVHSLRAAVLEWQAECSRKAAAWSLREWPLLRSAFAVPSSLSLESLRSVTQVPALAVLAVESLSGEWTTLRSAMRACYRVKDDLWERSSLSWRSLENAAAKVGIGRARRVRISRRIDNLEDTLLGSIYKHCCEQGGDQERAWRPCCIPAAHSSRPAGIFASAAALDSVINNIRTFVYPYSRIVALLLCWMYLLLMNFHTQRLIIARLILSRRRLLP